MKDNSLDVYKQLMKGWLIIINFGKLGKSVIILQHVGAICFDDIKDDSVDQSHNAKSWCIMAEFQDINHCYL